MQGQHQPIMAPLSMVFGSSYPLIKLLKLDPSEKILDPRMFESYEIVTPYVEIYP